MARTIVHGTKGSSGKPGGKPTDPGGSDHQANGHIEPDREQSSLEFEPDDQRSTDDNNGPGGGKPKHGQKFVDPTSAAAARDTGPKRGRPAGGKPAAAAAAKQPGGPSLSKDLSAQLFAGHIIAASWLKAPRLALTKDEADQFGAAIARLMQFYGLEFMDEKTRLWLGLLSVTGMIYGTRISSALIDAHKRKAAAKGPQRVVTMPSAQPAGDDPHTGLA